MKKKLQAGGQVNHWSDRTKMRTPERNRTDPKASTGKRVRDQVTEVPGPVIEVTWICQTSQRVKAIVSKVALPVDDVKAPLLWKAYHKAGQSILETTRGLPAGTGQCSIQGGHNIAPDGSSQNDSKAPSKKSCPGICYHYNQSGRPK